MDEVLDPIPLDSMSVDARGIAMALLDVADAIREQTRENIKAGKEHPGTIIAGKQLKMIEAQESGIAPVIAMPGRGPGH